MKPKNRISALLFLLASFANLGIADSHAADRPNIIFIMADDLGYGDLGSYGQKTIQTPHLDQMAAEGLRFTQVYAGSPVCAPSRSVLMTGLHTGHTTVRGNFGKTGVVGLSGIEGRVPLREEDVTVAEVLKKAGYRTGIVGKWGLGEPGTVGHPNEQGFDYWFGFLNQRRAHNYFPIYLWENNEVYPLPGNRDGKRGTYTHDLFTEKALDFIAENRRGPFFLYLPYTIPHDKYQIPDTAPYSEEDWEENEKVHAAMVTRMDRDIGRLFDLLRGLGIDENTVVFFCSDNGAAERWEGRFDSSGVLKGRKRDLYEGGIRTPMIVRWPGTIEKGVNTKAVWTFADVLPTLASLGGATAPGGLDGLDVSPSFEDKTFEIPERPLYWEFHERGFQQAIRWRSWKAIRLAKEAPLELYDLDADISESRNIADQHPKVVSRMEAWMESERAASLDWPGQ